MKTETDPAPRPKPGPSKPAETMGEWARGRPLPRDMHLLIGLGLPLILAAVCMWRLRAFTVDDAYISYRYARNLANGLGLVYNAGERIEGYTNFLFTCLLAAAIKLGLDPDLTAKLVGAAATLGTIACTFAISSRLSPLRAVPVFATWLLAGSVVTTGYSVFGLETSFFVFFILLATWLFLRERDAPEAFPWSGAALALAGLTRPEAPMFAGLLMLFLAGKSPEPGATKPHLLAPVLALFEKRNLVRAALFLVPVAAHFVFRRAYYGAWLPNTFLAKTGNMGQQLDGGLTYLRQYATHSGPYAFLPLGALWFAVANRRRDLLAIGAIALAVLAYVVLVGGDWMPYFRFLAPYEPFGFLLIDVAVRELVEARGRVTNLAIAAFAIYTAWSRGRAFSEGTRVIDEERRFWTSSAGGVAKWFEEHGSRGTIAVGDMGYIGYATDYPILDLLGLVDPVISTLPGGYTNKTGPGYVERVFDVRPRYFVFVGGRDDCVRLPFPAQVRLRNDARFRPRYDLVGQVRHSKDGFWCIFGPREERVP